MADGYAPNPPPMHIVVREERLPRGVVEVLETGTVDPYRYQVWWRPLSNRLAPVLCAVRRDRDLALGDLRWVVQGVTA